MLKRALIVASEWIVVAVVAAAIGAAFAGVGVRYVREAIRRVA